MDKAESYRIKRDHEDIQTYYASYASGEDRTDDDFVVVNLQKSSWREALSRWETLKLDPKKRTIENFVFIVNAIGLSLSQLLGKNISRHDEFISNKKIPPPSKILPILLKEDGMDAILNANDIAANEVLLEFTEINSYYDDSRHFGTSKQKTVDSLNFELITKFMNTAQNIWLMILCRAFYDRDGIPEEQLELFKNDFFDK